MSVYPKSLLICLKAYPKKSQSKLQVGQGSDFFPSDALQLDTLALPRRGILDAGFICTFSCPGPRGGPVYCNPPQGSWKLHISCSNREMYQSWYAHVIIPGGRIKLPNQHYFHVVKGTRTTIPPMFRRKVSSRSPSTGHRGCSAHCDL